MQLALFIVFAIFVFIGTFALMWWEDFEGTQSRWRFKRDLKRRVSLDLSSFYPEFYASSGIPRDIVDRFREFMARYWKVQAGMIRPQDDYLRINGDIDSLDFTRAVEQEFSIQVPDEDAEQLDGSFDTLLRYVAGRKTSAT